MEISVTGLVKEINQGLSQKSCSQKDEVRVMQALLNDRDYSVGVYDNNGYTGQDYCPAQDVRTMLASVISSAAHISADEASVLAEDHDFNKPQSQSFVNVSKEFVNTYLETGRKLNFGGRATSNISIIGKDVEASVSRYPKKVGEGPDGKGIYENAEKKVPAHKSAKLSAPCPAWVK